LPSPGSVTIKKVQRGAYFMLPSEFIEYSRRFSLAFLAMVKEGVPSIKVVEFEARPEYIIIKGGCEEGEACLVLANERYSENSMMAQVTGELILHEGECRLIPRKAYWTHPFTLSSYPREIVRRWYRR
jgi:hypothetical protein